MEDMLPVDLFHWVVALLPILALLTLGIASVAPATLYVALSNFEDNLSLPCGSM